MTLGRKSLEFVDGEQIAEQHIAAGRLRLRIFGMPAPWAEGYARLLEARYGVDVKFEGCLISDPDYVDGYNSRMEREIETQFGKGVLKEVAEEAKVNNEDAG